MEVKWEAAGLRDTFGRRSGEILSWVLVILHKDFCWNYSELSNPTCCFPLIYSLATPEELGQRANLFFFFFKVEICLLWVRIRNNQLTMTGAVSVTRRKVSRPLQGLQFHQCLYPTIPTGFHYFLKKNLHGAISNMFFRVITLVLWLFLPSDGDLSSQILFG